METESFLDLESDWKDQVIIAMKGLPCTGKTLVAALIGNWAKRPVLYIDDFIGAPDSVTAYDSWEEVERLQLTVLQQAFATLCRVAHSHIRSEFQCVVIKSRLASAFELDQLFRLVRSTPDHRWTLLIVECQVRNKHQWQERFNKDYYASNAKKWFRPRRWNDIEKAIDDHLDHQALAQWDRHLLDLIQQYGDQSEDRDGPILVRRLMVDPFYDVEVEAVMETSDINPIFAHAINHLLSAKPEELNHQNPYVVKFDEFRRSLAEDVVNALTSSERSEDICGGDGCLFKYWEELQVDDEDDDDDDKISCCCGVCGEKVVSRQPGYTCYYCILTVHRSCAEMSHFDHRSIRVEYKDLSEYIPELPASEKHACDSHLQGFREYCSYCCFQTVLRGRLVPLVVNHDHHPHHLSLRIRKKGYFCKACGVFEYSSSYVCRICEWYYHIQCLYMPGEWKHGHGGHDHALKLKYSQDDMDEEDYWCDVCFEDLDPYCWFYSCQSCPCYAAHLYCVGVYPRQLWSLRSI